MKNIDILDILQMTQIQQFNVRFLFLLQLHNIVYKLTYPVLEKLSLQLEKLRNCKGAAECERYGRSVW